MGATVGAYIILNKACCYGEFIKIAIVFLVAFFAVVCSFYLVIRRFIKTMNFFRDPKISYSESVFKDHKDKK